MSPQIWNNGLWFADGYFLMIGSWFVTNSCNQLMSTKSGYFLIYFSRGESVRVISFVIPCHAVRTFQNKDTSAATSTWPTEIMVLTEKMNFSRFWTVGWTKQDIWGRHLGWQETEMGVLKTEISPLWCLSTSVLSQSSSYLRDAPNLNGLMIALCGRSGGKLPRKQKVRLLFYLKCFQTGFSFRRQKTSVLFGSINVCLVNFHSW